MFCPLPLMQTRFSADHRRAPQATPRIWRRRPDPLRASPLTRMAQRQLCGSPCASCKRRILSANPVARRLLTPIRLPLKGPPANRAELWIPLAIDLAAVSVARTTLLLSHDCDVGDG